MSRLPGIAASSTSTAPALFCRNLGVLLGSGVSLTTTLRILVDIMATTGDRAVWTRWLPSACATAASCPTRSPTPQQLAADGGAHAAAGRRDRAVADARAAGSPNSTKPSCSAASTASSASSGRLAIIAISIIVGGLIVSVMTALLSVSQIVG